MARTPAKTAKTKRVQGRAQKDVNPAEESPPAPGASDKAREDIQAGLLVQALMCHALGKSDMTTTQIRAAEILLKKTVPDLQSIGGSLTQETVPRWIGPKPLSAEEWAKHYGEGRNDDPEDGRGERTSKEPTTH